MDYKEEFSEDLEDYIKENYEVYDRFTFDYLFRNLLQDGYDHEESKDIIIHNCALSTLVMQERIYNDHYFKICVDEKISDDLLELRNEIFNKYFKNRVFDTENYFYRLPYSLRLNNVWLRKYPFWFFAGRKKYYFKNSKRKKQNIFDLVRRYLTKLGGKLHIRLWKIYNLVLNRTYEGYVGEIQTIYGQLQELLGVKIHPAPDKWDRTYNVDFYIQVTDKYIGIQIKPISSGKALNQYQWDDMHETAHKKFKDKFGGKVFFVYSVKVRNKKQIYKKGVSLRNP